MWLLSAFCPKTLGSDGTVSFDECGRDTMRWWGHSYPILCKRICLYFLHSQVVRRQKFWYPRLCRGTSPRIISHARALVPEPPGGIFNVGANEVWGKVMFLNLCFILFTGGGAFAQHLHSVGRPRGGLGRPPQGTPPGCRPPPPGCRRQASPGCRPPDTSTSGRYASYWNAYLSRSNF